MRMTNSFAVHAHASCYRIESWFQRSRLFVPILEMRRYKASYSWHRFPSWLCVRVCVYVHYTVYREGDGMGGGLISKWLLFFHRLGLVGVAVRANLHTQPTHTHTHTRTHTQLYLGGNFNARLKALMLLFGRHDLGKTCQASSFPFQIGLPVGRGAGEGRGWPWIQDRVWEICSEVWWEKGVI